MTCRFASMRNPAWRGPQVYDWTATVPKILGSNAYDVIVVMLGANDTQAIRAGGTRIAFEARGLGRGLWRPGRPAAG